MLSLIVVPVLGSGTAVLQIVWLLHEYKSESHQRWRLWTGRGGLERRNIGEERDKKGWEKERKGGQEVGGGKTEEGVGERKEIY